MPGIAYASGVDPFLCQQPCYLSCDNAISSHRDNDCTETVCSSALHRLLAEYLLAAPSSLVADAVESLAGPGLLRMIHTRDGAQAGCAVMAYGSPKDRKKALKALKGADSQPHSMNQSCDMQQIATLVHHVGMQLPPPPPPPSLFQAYIQVTSRLVQLGSCECLLQSRLQ